MPAAVLPAAAPPVDLTSSVGHPPTGRHRRSPARSRTGRAFDVLATTGSLVTLGALLVLAAAAGGLVADVPATAVPTVTVTFDSGH